MDFQVSMKNEDFLDCRLTIEQQQYVAKIYLIEEDRGRIELDDTGISAETFLTFASFLIAAATISNIKKPYVTVSNSEKSDMDSMLKKSGFKWIYPGKQKGIWNYCIYPERE